MLKDIAVFMTGEDGDGLALDVGIRLARCFQARLSPMQVVELPEPAFNTWALLPEPAADSPHGLLRRAAAMAAERARVELESAHIDHAQVRVLEALYKAAWEAAAPELYCHDLVVASLRNRDNENMRQGRNAIGLLFQAGRPVLLVPSQDSPTVPAQKVLVAWRQAREAARAIHDAMPFLHKAESVEILVYDEGEEGSLHRRELVDHLWRHGVTARCIVGQSLGLDIASLILSHAEKTGAQLVVAGGYGHSRLLEWMLGGVTRGLIAQARVPLLLSH